MLSSTGEPQNLPDALNDPNWHAAMQDEYDALMFNKTWTLVPPSSNKISLIASGFIVSRDVLMVLLIVTKHGWLQKGSNKDTGLIMKILLDLLSR
jgi:hypothetical protein